ncbi:MAG: alpha/beta hydrolase [Rhizomicrobium sp.]
MPLLLLHGFPETHIAWRKLAPELAKHYSLVIPDLRGYGDSGKPDGGADHAAYAKREMARDMAEVMQQLGHTKFAVASHDRGSRVAHRLAKDYPDRVTRLITADILPTDYVYGHVDRKMATAYYHWFFLIQPAPLPENLIGGAVDAYLKNNMGSLMPGVIEPAAYAEYLRVMRDPAAIHGACEDYRAAAGIDLGHDAADRDKKIACPVLVLWGEKGFVGTYDVVNIWQDYAATVEGKAMPSGHFVPEQAPEAMLAEILRFCPTTG